MGHSRAGIRPGGTVGQLIGYDLDGTLCPSGPKREKPYFKQTGPERRAYQNKQREHYCTAPLILEPQTPFVIVTGRKKIFRPETEAWVQRHGLEPEGLYMLEGARTRQNMIAHKLAWCKKLSVARYYEDDEKIASALSEYGVIVVLVGKRGGVGDG